MRERERLNHVETQVIDERERDINVIYFIVRMQYTDTGNLDLLINFTDILGFN